MKAFVIDPFTSTITEHEYNGNYREIYALGDFDCFDLVTINTEGDGIFVDDEGLFKQEQSFFSVTGGYQPYAGKGVVLGSNDMGESVSPTVNLEWLQRNINFLGEAI